MKYAALLTALFLLAYQGKDQQQPDKLNAAYCYVNANSGDGTDLEIAEAIGRAGQIYGLDSTEIETLAAGYYGQ